MHADNYPILGEQEVHIWHARLAELEQEAPRLRQLLSLDEQQRADRFIHVSDRIDFCVARGVLRLLLEKYGIAPAAEISFAYSAQKKPSLDSRHESRGIEFNLSHSQRLAVYAFTRSRPIGIDVERLREVSDADEIVHQQFADEEKAAYQSLAVGDRKRAFFAAWTRKEAVLKALGTGLHRPLRSFAVTLAPKEPARVVRIESDAFAAEQWTLADWNIPPAYQVAVAVHGCVAPVFRIFPYSGL